MKKVISLIYALLFPFGLYISISQTLVDTTPLTTSKTYALVVGISSYQNIRPLKYADDDAYLFSKFLLDQNICTSNSLYLLIDSNATTANFYRDLKKILYKVKNNDKVFIYFAGHGDVETDLESGFLLTYNCEKNNYPASSIDITMLEKHINAFVNKSVNVILITDACRSGNLVGGIAGATNTISSISKGFNNVIKLLSCQPNQLSIEKQFSNGGHGVFTYYLVNGLSGMADKNNNYQVTLREIDTYLDEVSAETNNKQIPKVEGDPKAIVNQCNEEIKLSLLAKKGIGTITTRNVEFINDSVWDKNIYFQRFSNEIQKGNYIDGEINALSILHETKLNNQPDELINEMTFNLIAALEDVAQGVINNILIGNFSTQVQRERIFVRKSISYLSVAISLMEQNEIRKKEVDAKLIYFKCLDACIDLNYSKMRYYVNKLLISDSVLINQAWIKNLIGLTFYYLRNYNKSKDFLLSATKLSPSWSAAWNNLGLVYNSLNYHDSSKAAYLKSIELDGNNNSDDGSALSNLGAVYLELKDTVTADSLLKKSIQLNPKNPYPYNQLSALYKDQNNYELALKYLLESIKVDSVRADSWYELSDLYHKMGKEKDMDYAINKLISCDKFDLYYLKLALDFYHEKGYKKKASNLFNYAATFLKNNPNRFTSSYDYNVIADIYLNQQNIDSAKKYLELSLLKDSENLESLISLAYLAYYNDDIRQADSLVSIALSINFDYLEAQILKGRILYDEDNLSESEVYFNSAYSNDSTNSEILNYLGKINFWSDEFQKTEKYFLDAIRYDSIDANNWYWLGLFNLNKNLSRNDLKNINEAEFIKTIEIDSKFFYAFWYIGCIRYILNDTSNSLKYFEEALKSGYYDLNILKEYELFDNLKQNKKFKYLLKKYKISDL
jgi:tetratricopeptide (TPR) repeat protein